MRKQKPEKVAPKSKFEAAVLWLLFVSGVCGISYLLFWPAYCEGVVSNTEFQYGMHRKNVITFQDGRRMNFNGAMPIPIEKGKRYKFSYNWLDYVYSAKEME
jgi:hypothetical protein